MPFLTITGPTVERTDPGKAPDWIKSVAEDSFDTKLNAALADFDAKGITYEIHSFGQSLDASRHTAYIRYSLATTAAVAAPEYLTMDEFAKKLRVSRSFVSVRIRQGEIKAIHRGPRKLIPLSEYTRFATPR